MNVKPSKPPHAKLFQIQVEVKVQGVKFAKENWVHKGTYSGLGLNINLFLIFSLSGYSFF